MSETSPAVQHPTDPDDLRAAVRARYAAAAAAVTTPHPSSTEAALPVLELAGCCTTGDKAVLTCGL